MWEHCTSPLGSRDVSPFFVPEMLDTSTSIHEMVHERIMNGSL